jgi:hypothetical protein
MTAIVARLSIFVVLASMYVAAQSAPGPSLATLQTRAERSNFAETSRYDDVVAFLETVDRASPLVHVTSFGYTFEGRSLPLAVVGTVSDARADTVRSSGKLRVYRPTSTRAKSRARKRRWRSCATSRAALGSNRRLRAHGIVLERVEQPVTLPLEEFRIASTETTAQAFENHQERSVTGQWIALQREVPAGSYRVPMNQQLARLAFYLLEARSNGCSPGTSSTRRSSARPIPFFARRTEGRRRHGHLVSPVPMQM